MAHDINHLFTPQSAADHLGIGRTTVMNAIKALHLQAIRDNNSRWKITPEELDKWNKTRSKPVRKTVAVNDNASGNDIAVVSAENAGLRAEIKQLNLRLDDARANNDKLMNMMTEITKPAPSQSLWARIWGSRS